MTNVRKSKRLTLPAFPTKMYVFIIPAMAFFLIFWIFPILQLFYYSLTNFNGITASYDMVGFKNFKRIWDDSTLTNSLSNTMIYAVLMVVFGNLLGLGAALLLNTKIRGKTFFRTCCYLPALFSAIVVGFIWSYVYMPDSGMLSSVLSLFGIDGSSINILGNYKSALYGISIVEIWKGFGTTMIIYLAGLQTIDTSLLEAAKVDGCSEKQLITKIKLPLISSTITINVVLNVIAGLKAYDYSFIMTNGGPGKATKTLMFSIYELAFTNQKMGRASALSVVSFLLIIAITIFMLYFLNKKEVEV
ncbi:N-acetyl-D-glucosamine ABC transport system, permease protein 1 [Lachnospiraceae bacterium KM106-2]|nr:N-acetyl-D-glucosamine ABC transport system, permease protein 1 [Lachnospiraceae bacterium KM106-2]